jgi:hypothetical protein
VGYGVRTAGSASIGAGFAVLSSGTSDLPVGYVVRAGGADVIAVGYGVVASAFSAVDVGYRVESAGGGGSLDPAEFWGFILPNGKSAGQNLADIRDLLAAMPNANDIATAVWNKTLP